MMYAENTKYAFIVNPPETDNRLSCDIRFERKETILFIQLYANIFHYKINFACPQDIESILQ